MPKPCAPSRAGAPAHNHSAYLTQRRIRVSPDGLEGDGGIGWHRVALAPTLVKPMRTKASALFRATFGVAPRAPSPPPPRLTPIPEHPPPTAPPPLPSAA